MDTKPASNVVSLEDYRFKKLLDEKVEWPEPTLPPAKAAVLPLPLEKAA